MRCRLLLAALAALSVLAGCNTTKPRPSAQTAFAETGTTKKLDADDPVPMSPARWAGHTGLAGRTLAVASLGDLKLKHKEVVLTFDDGPVPGRTEAILDTLDRYGVKATFLMVGQMADAYPAIARKVVARGHTVGSHTYRHANLRYLAFEAAMAEIRKGEKAVERATARRPDFFRFPYLADTSALRSAVARRGTIIMDMDVDSKDYFKVTPASVASRTMQGLRKRGRGIILMHDIHKRTATVLPSLLAQLKAEGYSVVTLRHTDDAGPQLLAMAGR
ncbi:MULTISPECIES: polysaccharide deacetylase family protein [unclassified Shinella]|uniref:polysaccharide deacetylase family protein n=1 Tax=unclassified Shinella TaxID=2643062 RepID=UPI00225DAE7B|nr:MULTISPECIES: polysaccharide deacetylase family protein [unclassified Shinella]MCO5136062.1 polysaccharide deacetylase family protein [Shinella sp.]MDC7254301.1 polysaccharide deacetylase family protein [Shinella sp. YE25]CAI0336986.1 Chitooligosaccharide deacetylase [Rhizobiaceae bacterium]CAK7255512.1 peptidoglycan-N-acetylglucosamine deacetylase [Shinella sp. WSC3-e]